MQDREVAYEQNVSRLQNAWQARIESYAETAVERLLANEYADFQQNPDRENLRMEAAEQVAARLFDSAQWATIKATDISDIAYEAVGREISKL